MKKVTIVSAIAAALIGGSFAFGGVPGTDGKIHACYKNNGDLRIVDSTSAKKNRASCKKDETALSWNQQGLRGERGPEGLTGPTGAQGAKGDTGAQGLTGLQGAKGDTGLQGLKGDKGDKGDTGAQGDSGDGGLQGAKGDTGSQGLQGEKGEKGDKGDKGEPWTPEYAVAKVDVQRGAGSVATWGQYSTTLGSPYGDSTAGSFRFTCSAAHVTCKVSVEALGPDGWTVWPRILIHKQDINGGPSTYCEYGDGATNNQAFEAVDAPLTLGIGGSLDCPGTTQAYPAGGTASYIEVPVGYYDVQASFTFLKP